MSKYQLKPATVSQYVEKIMLQTLFDYHLFKEYFQQHQWDNDIANSLGLPSEMEDEDNSPELVEKLLKPRYKMLKNKAIITNKNF